MLSMLIGFSRDESVSLPSIMTKSPIGDEDVHEKWCDGDRLGSQRVQSRLSSIEESTIQSLHLSGRVKLSQLSDGCHREVSAEQSWWDVHRFMLHSLPDCYVRDMNRKQDAYPKINDDFYSRTLSGGLITLASSIFMLILFFSELRIYLHPVTESQLRVDTSRGEKLRINFDVTFPALACSIISLDSMDISGEQHIDVRHDIAKRRLDSFGNVIETKKDGIGHTKIENPLQKHGGRLEHNETYCGSCYGAEAVSFLHVLKRAIEKILYKAV
ncbi:unnamed protein product [Eruca vesicaria subsp. sativa]|uniref:Endoplasmic reticulum vesicle transporter N-terminal domain-containing protein n=1 Tax=Eruca vesicaria subsp. sativa TaxID=29727 RepID=A0ABC8J9F5_ERUVS|nr:unnamed protein product [Eruca vesicaria subsp. sativa]